MHGHMISPRELAQSDRMNIWIVEALDYSNDQSVSIISVALYLKVHLNKSFIPNNLMSLQSITNWEWFQSARH